MALTTHAQRLQPQDLMVMHGVGSQCELRPAPIDPGNVLAGRPTASAQQIARSKDGRTWTDVWECTPGSFRWRFRFHETVHVLSGSVTITSTDGGQVTLRAGDVAYFAAETATVWEVHETFRKVAVLSVARPGLRELARRVPGLRAAVRRVKRLSHRVGGHAPVTVFAVTGWLLGEPVDLAMLS